MPATTETAPRHDLTKEIVTVLAEIRQTTVAELEAEGAGRDLEMASPEAVAVIATLQTRFGRRLAQVEDLEPEQLTSVANLAELVHRRWAAGTPIPAGSES